MNPFEKLLNYKSPTQNEIPNISLYMDQLLEYFEGALGELKRQDEDSVLTKTMINNYVKSGLIKAPERKKYNREAISDLVVVYHMKKAFSIQDTSQILEIMKTDSEYYDLFIKARDQVRSDILTNLDSTPENISTDLTLSLIKQLSIEVSIKKQLTEQLIDYLNDTTRVQK